jgi:hypothetical protein
MIMKYLGGERRCRRNHDLSAKYLSDSEFQRPGVQQRQASPGTSDSKSNPPVADFYPLREVVKVVDNQKTNSE